MLQPVAQYEWVLSSAVQGSKSLLLVFGNFGSYHLYSVD